MAKKRACCGGAQNPPLQGCGRLALCERVGERAHAPPLPSRGRGDALVAWALVRRLAPFPRRGPGRQVYRLPPAAIPPT
eukprot:4604832-Alexandrium_andersonii.AAC.1